MPVMYLKNKFTNLFFDNFNKPVVRLQYSERPSTQIFTGMQTTKSLLQWGYHLLPDGAVCHGHIRDSHFRSAVSDVGTWRAGLLLVIDCTSKRGSKLFKRRNHSL